MKYNIQIITPATVYPVTLTELKTHLGITHTDHDTMLNDIIAGATNYAESYTWKVFGEVVLRMNIDGVMDTIIPRSPIQSIQNVKYYDSAGDLQTMDAADYDIDILSNPARVHFKTVRSTYDQFNAVQINFTAGYSDVTTIEKGLKRAILMVAADMYDQRGNIIHGSSSLAPINYESLFATYRENYYF